MDAASSAWGASGGAVPEVVQVPAASEDQASAVAAMLAGRDTWEADER